jgi:cell division septum initiation protein DivIVA
MPKVAIAESLSAWEGLLTSAGDLPLEDRVLSEELEELRTLLEKAKELHARRMQLEGERRAAAQALEEITRQAKTAASRVRSKLKGAYGPNSSQLIRFGIKPRPLARGDAPPEPLSSLFKKE